MSNRFRNCMITVNNPPDNYDKNFENPFVVFAVWQYERGDSGTLHIQAYAELSKQMRLKAVSEIFPNAHIEKRMGTQAQAIEYCTKAETRERGPFKIGETKLNHRQSNSFISLLERLKKGETLSDLYETDPEPTIKSHDKLKLAQQFEEMKQSRETLSEKFETPVLREWQYVCVKKLETQDDRHILFVVDRKGNNGKSWLCDYIEHTYGGVIFSNAKTSDIAYAYHGEPYVCFDFSRTLEGRINYSIIEQIKNGRIFSTKYKSKSKRFQPPKIVCMMNFSPDMLAFSADRYDILEL